MSTVREARRDAVKYAKAAMARGEGAGIRRRDISADVNTKSRLDPTYARAFRDELDKQDMGEHARKARSERRRKDAAHSIKRNTKAAVSGDYQNLTGPVLVAVVAGYIIHQTGADRVVIDKSKQAWRHAKIEWARYKIRRDLKKYPNLRY